jgi:hypothetical protein
LAGTLDWPAYGLDPAWTVCCANAAARRLFVGLFEAEASQPPNLLRYIFTHREARRLLPDWPERCERVLAEFRRDYGRVLGDPRVAAMVEWLRDNSEAFRTGWTQQAVLAREGGLRRFQHPEDGPLAFIQHTLAEVERGDFRLVALQPSG